MGRREVVFEGHGGVRLRGVLHLPERTPAPAVVMAHGFSAVKEMALDGYVETFREAGLAVLVYDHRNLGASEGEPRQEINPWAQARDFRRALDWMEARPEVEAKRLALWGSSFSGGEVIVVGAVDERVRAVVANVPFAGLPGADYSDTRPAFEAIRANLLDESGRGLADAPGTVMGPIAVVEDPEDEGSGPPVFLPQPESNEWFLKLGARPGSTWRNRVTLRNAFGTDPAFDPGACIAHVSPTPLLLVVASEDRLAATDATLAAYERAGEPKRLVMVEGHHFVPYEGAALQRAAGAARDFLLEHLRA
jgi:uncharacterized protein